MLSPNGRFVIVFNGEIYNFRELRADLETKGERFVSSGDTEVLLRIYMREGVGALARLNGMFAFAIWDRESETLFGARDRFGEKPFFYWPRPGDRGLIFASELNALVHHQDVERRLDVGALSVYLANSYITGTKTILSDVRRLPPAHWMRFKPGRPLEIGQYWDLASQFRNKRHFLSEAEAADELKDLVEDSVRLRLVSDVPLGAFLSGGVDSSIIVSAMLKSTPRETVRTYSMGFEERGFSELPFARDVARQLGVSLSEAIVTPELSHDLPCIAGALGEPFADTSVIPMYYLARHARRQVTVALSGDGGDELFAGYDTYVADRLHHQFGPIPLPLTSIVKWLANRLIPMSHRKVGLDYKTRQFMRGLSLPSERAHWFWRNIFDLEMRQSLLRHELREAAADDGFCTLQEYFAQTAGCHPLDQATYVDMKTWLADSVLVKVDRATMAHSLESRAPFLDYRVAEFTARLPAAWKLKGFRKKYLLRKAFAEQFAPGTLNRTKQGFGAPVSHWLAGSLGPLAQDVFASRVMTDLFRPEIMERLFSEHRERRLDHGQRLFNLLMFGLWRLSFNATLTPSNKLEAEPSWRYPSLYPP